MNLLEFLGKFHPLAVHLPIGILTIFIVLGLFISRKKLLDSLAIIRLILLVSALSATFSSISGFLLSNADSYDLQLVSFHQWSGFSLTILNWLLYFKIEYLLDASIRIYRISLVVILLGLIVTGHAGGSLTHGSDFFESTSTQSMVFFQNRRKEGDILEHRCIRSKLYIIGEKMLCLSWEK